MEHSMWGHLPLLVRSNSKESVEYILQALWRTRKTGLDAADREIIREMLQLPNETDLDPLLVCLRILMRRCVYENTSKDKIQKLFPKEVSPELQRLLTILLQKFQREWRDDAVKDQVTLPRLKAMTWNMANHNTESVNPAAIINLKKGYTKFIENRQPKGTTNLLQKGTTHETTSSQWMSISNKLIFFTEYKLKAQKYSKLQDDSQSILGAESEVKFQLAKDTLDTMLKSMYYIRDQLSNTGEATNGHFQAQETNTL